MEPSGRHAGEHCDACVAVGLAVLPSGAEWCRASSRPCSTWNTEPWAIGTGRDADRPVGRCHRPAAEGLEGDRRAPRADEPRRPNSPRTDIGHHVHCPSRTVSSVSAQGHSPSTHSVVPRGTSMCPSLLVPDARRPTTIPAEVVRSSSTVTVPPCDTRPGRRGPYERCGSAPTVRFHVKPGGSHGGRRRIRGGSTWNDVVRTASDDRPGWFHVKRGRIRWCAREWRTGQFRRTPGLG
ncbi:unannotated protein [freshwater metagenome]|uniref:Unannotated protein n=1 Tax=freshwater metagenome TaxID=449393 RepID=A0A6J6CKC8_9ZZZZ